MVGCQKIHKRLIIVITGANAGIGFGICHRFLVQLSQPTPPDASFYFTSLLPDEKAGAQFGAFESCSAGVTIIMACRDVGRAEAARTKLYGLLDAHIAKINNRTPSYHYAVEFRTNLQIQIHRLDLSDIHSVLHFGKEISQKYPYISHLICNAGVATYSHIDYLIFFRQCLESPLLAVRHPAFNVQTNGAISKDNLGFVWQCNVFGHYVLYRALQPLLSSYSSRTDSIPSRSPARVLWMSSIDTLPTYDPVDDWQLIKTCASYQASKFQVDLICMELSRREQQRRETESGARVAEVQHFLVSPGITATNMAATLLKPWPLELLMLLFFHICRLFGSPHVLFSLYKAAVAAVHISLVPSAYIPSVAPAASSSEPTPPKFPKFSAINDRWGNEGIGIEGVTEWDEHPDEGARLVEQCERLYQTFLEAEGCDDASADGATERAS
ncbi:hypothetical protein AcV7_009969 [Taiwanofungus camphoratus]|nr:hypothetical protein AcV7_009969 [Antrodia cinnamomea]